MDKYFTFKNYKIKYSTLFWILLMLISFYYGYNKILFIRPSGIHQWRACFSANNALNMYYEMDFFKLHTGSFIAKGNTIDVTVPAEAPLLYYAVAILYKIFGYHEFLYRLLNVIIGMMSLCAVFRLTKLITKNYLISFFIPVILFTSAIYIFYLNNFLTDVTSLSFSLFGFYYFFKFIYHKKYIDFAYTMLMVLIAALLKAPALLIFFSILGYFFLEVVLNVKLNGKEKVFKKPLKYIAGFTGVIIILGLWYYYAKHYTDTHGGITSTVSIRTILGVNDELKGQIWAELYARFKKGYFHSPVFLYFSALLFIMNIVFIKKYNPILSYFTITFFIIGLIGFNFMFFYSIGRCDYYQINNLLFLVPLYLNFTLFLKENYNKIFQSRIFKLAIIILSIVLIHDGKLAIKNKYSDWHYRYSMQYVNWCGDITPYLRNLGIERDDRVYFTPDPSINVSLYLMDQKGNTDYSVPGKTTKEKIEYLKTKGLKYVLIAKEEILNEEGIKESLYNKIGDYNGVQIFKVFEE